MQNPILDGYPCGASNLDYVLEVNCSDPCPPGTGPCLPPPDGMVAWWTLDEPAGPTAADSIFANDGAYQPDAATGPTPIGGFVDAALLFDGANDFVEVPHASVHDFQCGAFSIDAWVRFDPFATFPGGGIVTKDGIGTSRCCFGYSLELDSGGVPTFYLEDTTFTRCVVQATSAVAANQWTHVAVTVAAFNGVDRATTFYIDGAPAGSFNVGCACVDNMAPLRIGNGTFNLFFDGAIDEVELFDRVLTAGEVLDLFDAGAAGKCKQKCHVPWDEPFCLEDNSVIVPVTVCNCSPAPATYQLAFAGLPTGPDCSIIGPTTFTVLGSNPVNVGPYDCVTVNVEIDRPSGMNAVYQVGCYEVQMTNFATGFSTVCHGSVQDRRDLCAVFDPDPIGVIEVPVGLTQDLSIVIENTDAPVDLVPYEIRAFDSGTMLPADTISLDGLPPGEPVTRSVKLPPRSTGQVDFTVTPLEHEPFGFFDIVMLTDVEGDGVFEPLVSVGLRTTLEELPIPADLDGDGAVNGVDLGLLLGSWGECRDGVACPADLTGDEEVDGADLGTLLASWTG